MLLLSPQQIQELINIIELQHLIFIGENVGSDTLSVDDKNILKRYGINISKFPVEGKVTEMFKFGILADALKNKGVKSMSYNEFKRFLSSSKFLPLSKIEQAALMNVKMRAYSDIKGLGNKINKDFTNIVIEADKKKRIKYEKLIKKEIAEGILERKTVKEISSALGHKTGDWARDFDRIADFVMHSAFDAGKAESILRSRGEDALVYKEVYPEACESCEKLYLTGKVGSKPIIFKLKELLNNGTNIGKKKDEWKPVIGSTHPWSLIEGRTVVLTDNGWKMIKDIKIDDKVLTHKKRFKKVVSVLKGLKVPKNYPIKKFFKISYTVSSKENHISITAEHKILTQRGWIQAQDLTINDKLLKLMRPCSCGCGKYIDYFDNKYSKNTFSKKCENRINKKNAFTLHNVDEEKYKIFKNKISEKVKENWRNNVYEKTLKELKSKEHRKKSSERMIKDFTAVKLLEMSGNKLTSKPQKRIFELVKQLHPEAKLEYRIFNRQLDIAIPDLKIDIEFDGKFWHKNRKEDDNKRDKMLRKNDWSVIRYSKISMFKELKNDIEIISNNHNENYKLKFIKINKIEICKLHSYSHKLYDIGIEEDESFITRGIVIHNCRCELIELPKGYVWESKEKNFKLKRVGKHHETNLIIEKI